MADADPAVPLGDEFGNLRRKLRALSDQLTDLGTAIDTLHEQGALDALPPCSAGNDEHLLQLARRAVAARSARDRHFPPRLFADPAWDMLLDLFIARINRATVCVSSLCIAARVPPTTALRWIRSLEVEGALNRAADPDDGRRILVAISDDAFDGVRAALLAGESVAFRRMPGHNCR